MCYFQRHRPEKEFDRDAHKKFHESESDPSSWPYIPRRPESLSSENENIESSGATSVTSSEATIEVTSSETTESETTEIDLDETLKPEVEHVEEKPKREETVDQVARRIIPKGKDVFLMSEHELLDTHYQGIRFSRNAGSGKIRSAAVSVEEAASCSSGSLVTSNVGTSNFIVSLKSRGRGGKSGTSETSGLSLSREFYESKIREWNKRETRGEIIGNNLRNALRQILNRTGAKQTTVTLEITVRNTASAEQPRECREVARRAVNPVMSQETAVRLRDEISKNISLGCPPWPYPAGWCWRCLKFGHLHRQCKAPPEESLRYYCFRCGRPNIKKEKCPTDGCFNYKVCKYFEEELDTPMPPFPKYKRPEDKILVASSKRETEKDENAG